MCAAVTSTQLALDLSFRPALGAEDFLVSQSNETAVKLIDNWPGHGQYGQFLTGPAASGKSHLVNVWRLRTGARMIRACDLDLLHLQEIASDRPVCVEDIDGALASEDVLFHLLNLVRENGAHILLTAKTAGNNDIVLKDLRSRLQALPVVSIAAPDDDLLMAVMIKLFADRQIEVEPRLVHYLMKRTERSMQAVAQLVDDLDRGSLVRGRRLTRPLAREILALARQ